MLNSKKIENLKYIIINYINNSEIFDENYIFNLAKNYAKENKIEITKGEIKTLIYNIKICNEIKTDEDKIY